MSPQSSMFAAAVACGAAAILLWDVFHQLRMLFFKGIVVNIILDILWWSCVAYVFVSSMWYYGFMNLRFFVFFGFAAGAFLYRITLSRVVGQCFLGFFTIFYKIIKIIFKILLTPAAFLYKILIVNIIIKRRTRPREGNGKWKS